MKTEVYIKGERIDLFRDERISINLQVKNVSDIAKIKSDFTQTFSVPASPKNNQIFSYWFDAAVDGTFNANVRQEGYIEVDTLPFRFGSIQLTECKLKGLEVYSYSITFFSKVVNLIDAFRDDKLSELDLTQYDHAYNPETVVSAMASTVLSDGDIYYPLISAHGEMSIGGPTPSRDLLDPDNEIEYREFKPAIREIRLIEAIEEKYGFMFSRDFFDRSLFYNKFFWLHKDADYMKAYGQRVLVDITSGGEFDDIQFTVNTANDTVTYSPVTGLYRRQIGIRVTPSAGFETTPYKVIIENNGTIVSETELEGQQSVEYSDGAFGLNNVIKFYVSGSADFSFTTRIRARRRQVSGSGSPPLDIRKFIINPEQDADGYIFIKDQMPDMKVSDYFKSLIKQFNLVLVPTTDGFYVDTLDVWYEKGKAYDITPLVDIKDVTVKRSDIKREVNFRYQETGSILAERYRINNGIGYGDLSAQFDVSGDELEIETLTENMLFERLENETEGDLTDIQAGFAIDKELKPYKGKPFTFYRAGFEITETPIYVSGLEITSIWHTATEDNILANQVTSSLNFGADISSYLYQSVPNGLYFNFWKTYIEELYDRKTRVYSIKAQMPSRILQSIRLNDRLVFRDYKYKISSITPDLTTGETSIEMFSDLGPPIDSVETVIPLTVDSTEYTVDSELLTVDQISIHQPVTSYITNGISREQYAATPGEEYFEVKVTANTNWTVTKQNEGDGTNWFHVNKAGGLRTDYVRVKVDFNIMDIRQGSLLFSIGSESFELLIEQEQL